MAYPLINHGTDQLFFYCLLAWNVTKTHSPQT
jgi:hypothetical protein